MLKKLFINQKQVSIKINYQPIIDSYFLKTDHSHTYILNFTKIYFHPPKKTQPHQRFDNYEISFGPSVLHESNLRSPHPTVYIKISIYKHDKKYFKNRLVMRYESVT